VSNSASEGATHAHRKLAIPDGFEWSHAKDTFVNKIGETFNTMTGERMSANGLVLADEPPKQTATSEQATAPPNTDAPSAIPMSTQPNNSVTVDTVASRASGLTSSIGRFGASTSRELSIAQTKLDEAMMWIERHERQSKAALAAMKFQP
jgi:hypothetical protein